MRNSSPPSRPKQLGDYEVVVKIAGGGLSTIYLARNVKTPGPPVALKVIRNDLSGDARFAKMFDDEAQLLSRLVHPNVVRTLEARIADSERFIAMELMLGVTVAAVHDECVARGVRLAPELVAWIGARVGDALTYAHGVCDEDGKPLGLVHRDVNPRNLLLTFEGEVKLFDFGLAKMTARDGGRTSPGIIKGTLPYVSPEHFMQMPLDGRADVFGLGTTLWELLTGRRLFRRDTDADTARAVQRGPIPDPREVAPEVPTALSAIVKKALERNREHRYATAADLSRDLDTVARACDLTDAPDRLAKLVRTLFPSEYTRQRNWLKPPVQSLSTPTPSSIRPMRR